MAFYMDDWTYMYLNAVIYIFFQVLDANKEYTEITELYEDKRQDILCGFV